MVKDRYIWCRTCGAIHHVTPFDRAPLYHAQHGDFVEQTANDWQLFMDRHSGHRLEPMLATGRDYYEKGLAGDPMNVRYLEIGNGVEALLLRRSRGSVAEPVQYSIVDGQFVEADTILSIQEDAIRREMKLHFSWAPASAFTDENIDRFLGCFREVVRSLAPARAQETASAATDENTHYCELDDAALAELMGKCAESFQWAELECLRRFIESHRQADDVMALIKHRKISIEKRSEQPSAS